MKNVIIVAPSFSPSNLTAVHRSRIFAMNLHKFGWRTRVLTVDHKYYEEELDWGLVDVLPDDLEIVKTAAFPTKPLRVVGDIGIRSLVWHYRELSRMVEQDRPDMIMIPIPPNYSALLGRLIHRKYRVPYVIDYIDPWINEWPGTDRLFSKAWLSLNASRLLEPWALRGVSLITGVAPGYCADLYDRYRWLDGVELATMPYGFEKRDYEYLDQNPRENAIFNPGDGKYHIVYAGAMLPKAFSTLNALLTALKNLLVEDPGFAGRIRFHFIGTGKNPIDPGSYNIKPVADEAGLAQNVTEHPARIGYLDVLNVLKQSSAVLVLGSSERHYTPSKAFQAVMSERPVFAILHRASTGVDILRRTGAATVVTFDDKTPADTLARDIGSSLKETLLGGYDPESVNWKMIDTYSGEAVTGVLAAALDRTLESCRRRR